MANVRYELYIMRILRLSFNISSSGHVDVKDRRFIQKKWC